MPLHPSKPSVTTNAGASQAPKPKYPALNLTAGKIKTPRAISRSTPFDELPQLMTEAELAAYMSITEKKLRRLSHDGGGPNFKKVGREHLYDRADVIAWIKQV